MTIVIDIETSTVFSKTDPRSREDQLRAMKFAIAVTYDTNTDIYSEWRKADIVSLWHYLLTDTVTGWNIDSFDLPVIRYNIPPTVVLPVVTPVTRDLFSEIRAHTLRWYPLGVVAETNFGEGKIGSGSEVAEWLAEYERTQDQALLLRAFEYCRKDVELEYQLYKFLEDGNELYLPPIRDERKGIYYSKNGVSRFVDQKEAA